MAAVISGFFLSLTIKLNVRKYVSPQMRWGRDRKSRRGDELTRRSLPNIQAQRKLQSSARDQLYLYSYRPCETFLYNPPEETLLLYDRQPHTTTEHDHHQALQGAQILPKTLNASGLSHEGLQLHFILKPPCSCGDKCGE